MKSPRNAGEILLPYYLFNSPLICTALNFDVGVQNCRSYQFPDWMIIKLCGRTWLRAQQISGYFNLLRTQFIIVINYAIVQVLTAQHYLIKYYTQD